MKDKNVYAEDINYWKTSELTPDTWIDKCKALISDIGGKVMAEAFGSHDGKAAFMLRCRIAQDEYHIVWEVLPSRTNNAKAAKIQAATLMFHDVKYKVVMAKIKGVRTAFLEYLLLPNGMTAAASDSVDLMSALPMLLPAFTNVRNAAQS